MTNELLELCSDEQLNELFELAKSSEDLLDLLTPRENQHSDLLAWSFNAREGHGQGDSILKDFLLAVYWSATNEEAGDRIFGRGLTRDFVRAWTPARIMTSSFATAICYREYKINDDRLDLILIDIENRLLIAVENKAGARFRTGQLTGYLESVQKSLLSRAAFKDFNVAFVAMDIHFDPEAEAYDADSFDQRWARLNYDWLRPSAKRAELSVKRGNQSAAVLLSYCRRQTGWEPDSMRQMTRLARDLAIRYPSAIDQLKQTVAKLYSPESWTPGLLSQESEEGQLLRLYLQNEIAIGKLLHLPPLQLLHARICEHVPALEAENDQFSEYGRVWRRYRLPLSNPIPMTDSQWPLYLGVRHLEPDQKGALKIKVVVHWRPVSIPADERPEICDKVSTIYPGAKDTQDRKNGKKLVSEVYSSIDAAEAAIVRIFNLVDRAFG